MEIVNMPFPEKKYEADMFHINIIGLPCIANVPHTHNYFQIYYVINSRFEHYVEGDCSTIARGDMFIVPPGKMHYVELQPDSRAYCFSFYLDFVEKGTIHSNLALQFLHKLQSEPGIRPKLTMDAEDIFYTETVMAHILKEFTAKRFGYKETILQYTLLLLTIFARSYLEENGERLPTEVENSKQQVLHCIEYIENNFTEDITLSSVCRRSAMSKSSFCALFSQLTGSSFHTYLNMCRIKKATEYIKSGYGVTGIYGLCGYNHYSAFYRNFKKIMGITPQVYKKDCK